MLYYESLACSQDDEAPPGDEDETWYDIDLDVVSQTGSESDLALSDKENGESIAKPSGDANMESFIIYFQQARLYRAASEGELWFGIMGTTSYLNGIRIDLAWAQHCLSFSANREVRTNLKEFYFSQHISTKYTVSFSFAIAIVNCLVFAVEVNFWTFVPMWQNNTLGPGPQELLLVGAMYPPNMVELNEWWRAGSCLLLHSGVYHFVACLAFLLHLGNTVEAAYGRFHTTICFLCTGIGGNLIGSYFNNVALSAGGSVGIFGWLGLSFVDVIQNLQLLWRVRAKDTKGFRRKPERVTTFITLWVCCFFGFTKTRFIDGFSHGGAFWLGIGYGVVTLSPLEGHFLAQRNRFTQIRDFIKFVALVTSVASVVSAVVLLVHADEF